ncbi:cilia- and flagella-associated protein 54 isoform X2 [Ascaphus truei]|uniref:cilia- and flagella-associated protein 54 isoform X2 n=1 Tax=Ascaphus truei TaxID=8439 RepID=UPI003F5ACF56
MEPLPATFYGDIDQKNPVIATFEGEVKQLLGFMRKMHTAPPGERQHVDYRRGSRTLFNIWVKYKPRLPAWYYQEKLLKVGDGLAQIKEYRLALFQCYGRYLEQFCSVDIDDITDVNQFKSTFFPSGTEDKNAGLTFHALQGRCICIYQLVKTSDGNLQNEESVKKCLNILSFLQLIMQVVLPQEHLCWLIYNGTLHIYTICRHLMVLGHSSKALEFLLWASVCMESSVPLLSVHYLTWRSTLYTAVCQCYFDCHAGVHGEVFARRALGKINELSQLENMSNSSYSEEAKKAFREATTKMAVMVFKRAVLESRRKPKGILRPKQKSSLKDLEKLQWPRTNTERLLVEMFDNGAVHFLAVLEALSDSNRRVFQAGPPVPDEPEIHDVIAELFFAGIDILSGGGNRLERVTQRNPQSELCKMLKQSSLLELAVEEKDAVSVEAVVRFAKLAFSYEQWDVFDAIITPLYTFLQTQDNSKWKKEEMELKILIAAEPLLSGKKHKHGLHVQERSNKLPETTGSLGHVGFQEEYLKDRSADDDDDITLAETVFSCVCNSLQDVRPDKDIVIDVILFLWQKCKTGIQRLYAGATDGSKFVQKCEMNSKWISILCLIYEVMQHCNIIDTDTVIMGEAALRLAGISESMADAAVKSGRKPDKSYEKANVDSSSQMQSYNKPVFLKNPVAQLIFAYETLEKAIQEMSMAHSLPNETSVIDHYCTTLGVRRPHLKNTTIEQNKAVANNMMMDLQLELIVAQHRVSVKLLNVLQGDGGQLRASKSSVQKKGNAESIYYLTESEIFDKINKNKLSKAIFLMQKALLFNNGHGGAFPNQLLEDSEKLIHKAAVEENAVYLSCVKQSEPLNRGKKVVPPPPILLSRTENSMVFKPAFFKSDVKVSWYCLFARCATGPNLKVRLSDHHLPGTGEEIPAISNNIFEVKGLQPNEKYIFAVAAYSSDGIIIGDAIGEATKAILAFPPLSVPATWAYLAQIAYHVSNYKVAKKAFSVLWNYFVLAPISPPTDVAGSASNELYVSQKRLCFDAMSKASPILLHLFLGSIFISSDINIKEGALFCDSICDNGVLYKSQICRLAECERLLVALDISILLSDVNYALQAVVQCYGLIAPMIYHKISSVPVVQILMKCLAVLQEIPSSTWHKKQSGCTEGVLHMIACIAYYLAKVLRSWEEYEVAIAVIEGGKKLLEITENKTSLSQASQSKSTSSDEAEKAKDTGDREKLLSKGHSQRKHQKKQTLVAEKVNEQLSALEQNLLKMTNVSSGINLTGNEDPLLLHAVVSCWPLNSAFKEIMKFKKKSRFLEFFAQLLQRVVYEEKFLRATEWATIVFDHLKRRNENLYGNKKSDDTSDVTASGDSFRRYTAALVEYHKGQEPSTLKQATKPIMSEKNKKNLKTQHSEQPTIKRNPGLHRNPTEVPGKRAFAALVVLLTPIVSRYIKRKRLINACKEEMPWRSQVNLLLAFTHFSLFRKKLGEQCNEELGFTQTIQSYSVLDPELFSLHHAGTVVMATEINAMDERISSPGHLHPSLKLDLSSGVKLTVSNDFSEKSTKRSEVDTPLTQMTNDTETSSRSTKEQAKLSISSVILFDHLGKVFTHLKRAVVLAHRGGHWTLLQNTCRFLWNLTLELQFIAKQVDITKGPFLITKDLLNTEIWMPFYFAADMILDMIVIIQDSGSIKVVDAKEEFSVPSCMGGIAYEEGGSNLTFEYPIDDVNVVDMRWISDLVLKAIELLYHVKRWEALVHIAIQFNLISHERYTEQVTPLLVHAQRLLTTEISDINGPYVTQPHFNRYMIDHNEKIHCRNYIGKQLHVSTGFKKDLNPEANIDRKEHIVHSDGRSAKAFVCVPLDVMDTLACFRDSLQKSKYPSRALKHSRKLLTLFLAYGQELNTQEWMFSEHTTGGKVGFSAGAMQAHQAVPPDLLLEEFPSVCTIESNAIPPSQLSAVISSYDKTIEILHSNNQQGLKAQALHELGNLHLYAGNKRAAFRCWCQALDETLNMSDALNSWQELDSSQDSISNGRSKDYSEKFLCRAGIWGCLQAAVITAKISRYILTSNFRKRTKCCILSTVLFKALFLVSLPHPKKDCDYALYEIGDGCEISELIPGIDLFSDRYRADINTVVASLGFLMSELHSAAQNLMILPLFTLYQYFVAMVCCDPVRSVEGRLLKVKVLTDLHLFTEAFHELCLLNYGKRIPRRPYKGFRPVGKPVISLKFSSSKTVLASENLQAIEEIFNRKPSTSLLSVCDQATMNKLMLAKTQFILKLSSMINGIPETVKKSSYYVTEESTKHQSKDFETVALGQIGHKIEDTEVVVRLTSKDDLTLPKLKGILLSEAEERLDSFLQDLQIKHCFQLLNCPAVELEMAIEAKLQLFEIAQQRHQTAASVAMAYSAVRLLQQAQVFTVKHQTNSQILSPALKQSAPGNEKKAEEAPKILDTSLSCDTEARERLNIRIWFRCRLALVTALAAQMRGIAIQEENMLDCSAMITEGIIEAETFSDVETQAHLMLQAAFLDIQEGQPKKGIKLLLEDIVHLLEERHFHSLASCVTLAQSYILLADIMEMEKNKDQQLFWTTQLNTFTLAHNLLIKQLASLGEAIEHHGTDPMITSPLQPLRNIYLPPINLLAKVKLRIGHVLALKACFTTDSSMDPSHLLPSLNLHATALELCRISSFREYDVEADLLFQRGKIEHQMFVSGDREKSLAIKSFSEAINVSRKYDQNFGLIKKSYLEIALLYLHMESLDTNQTTGMVSPTLEATRQKEKVDKVKEKDGMEKTWSPPELYRLLAWIAIRAATQVGDAMLACKQLIGQNTVTVHAIKAKLHQHIPTFACMDLLASYKNYLPDDCYKNICEQERTVGSPREEGREDRDKLYKGTLSWVHLIHYHNHLMRLKNMINLTGSLKTLDGKLPAGDTLCTSIVSNGITLRFAEMHRFLKEYLYAYATCCVNKFPQELLQGLETPITGFYIPFKTILESKEVHQVMPLSEKVSSNDSTDCKADILNEHVATNSLDKELCLQWYLPSLERLSEQRKSMVLLLYAYNAKNVNVKDLRNCNPANLLCGNLWIPLARNT